MRPILARKVLEQWGQDRAGAVETLFARALRTSFVLGSAVRRQFDETSGEFQDLVLGLTFPDPRTGLGAVAVGDVRHHPFFPRLTGGRPRPGGCECPQSLRTALCRVAWGLGSP